MILDAPLLGKAYVDNHFLSSGMLYESDGRLLLVVPELLRTLVFARPCGGDQFAAGTVSPSLDMSR